MLPTMLTTSLVTLLLGATQIFAAPMAQAITASSLRSRAANNACQAARLQSISSANDLNSTLNTIIPLVNNTILAFIDTPDVAFTVTLIQGDIDEFANPTPGKIPPSVSGGKFLINDATSILNGASSDGKTAQLKSLFDTAKSQLKTWQGDANAAIDACAGPGGAAATATVTTSGTGAVHESSTTATSASDLQLPTASASNGTEDARTSSSMSAASSAQASPQAQGDTSSPGMAAMTSGAGIKLSGGLSARATFPVVMGLGVATAFGTVAW